MELYFRQCPGASGRDGMSICMTRIHDDIFYCQGCGCVREEFHFSLSIMNVLTDRLLCPCSAVGSCDMDSSLHL